MKKKFDEGMPFLANSRNFNSKQTSNSLFTKLKTKSGQLTKNDSDLKLSNLTKREKSKLLQTAEDEKSLSCHEKRRQRAVSNNQRIGYPREQILTDISKMAYVPPPSNFSSKQAPEEVFDDTSDQGFREIDEKLLANEDDQLNIPTNIKIKKTEITLNLQEKLDDEA